jgi:hypothetical protein
LPWPNQPGSIPLQRVNAEPATGMGAMHGLTCILIGAVRALTLLSIGQ